MTSTGSRRIATHIDERSSGAQRHWAVLLVTLIIIATGCTKFDQDKELTIRCDAECAECKDLKIECSQDWNMEKETESEGVISGSSTGGG